MGNISFIQIIIFFILMLLIFGDLSKILDKIKNFKLQKRSRKKGS